jgi:hypothetical protein
MVSEAMARALLGMDYRYSIVVRASTGGSIAALRQVLESKGMFGVLSDGNDANLVFIADTRVEKRAF